MFQQNNCYQTFLKPVVLKGCFVEISICQSFLLHSMWTIEVISEIRNWVQFVYY